MPKLKQNKDWKYYYEKCMFLWAIFGQTWLLLQVIKIYQTQDVSGLAIVSYILLIFGAVVWFIYACFVLPDRNWIIIVNSSISFVLAWTVVAGILLYAPPNDPIE